LPPITRDERGTDGNFRLNDEEPGHDLHEESTPQTDGDRRHAQARAGTRVGRISPHTFQGWKMRDKNRENHNKNSMVFVIVVPHAEAKQTSGISGLPVCETHQASAVLLSFLSLMSHLERK
jgi:hypothetical protein